MVNVRIANERDFETIAKHDKHISETTLKKKIANNQILIAEMNGEFVGWLRWGLFWDEIPFMNMLYVLEKYQNKRIGTTIVRKWEQMMLAEGFDKVMTSTLEQESAKYFYCKLGYRNLGKFTPFADEYEIVMGKNLLN